MNGEKERWTEKNGCEMREVKKEAQMLTQRDISRREREMKGEREKGVEVRESRGKEKYKEGEIEKEYKRKMN